MAARRADEAARRVSLQPSFILAAVPDAVFRSDHPASPFAVENGQVSNREPECSRQQAAGAPFVEEELVPDLGLGKRIDCHAESIARGGIGMVNRPV